MLNATLQRERTKSTTSEALSDLKTLERELQRKMESEGYVIAAFKGLSHRTENAHRRSRLPAAFTKVHGYRQPRFLQRIKTPTNTALANTR